MLDEFGIVGVSWRHDGSEALARYTLGDGDQAARLRSFGHETGLREIAYLETCNRVEVIFLRNAENGRADLRPAVYALLTGRAAQPGEAERVLKAWQGEGACEHLFLVAAGLDSAALGETEIVGQVRASRDLARKSDLIGPGLELLFEDALRVAGAVRDRTRLAEGSISLAELAAGHILAPLAQSSEQARPTALVGVSAMTERAALSLDKAGAPFVVVNRTASNARDLAGRFGVPFLSLASFRSEPPAVGAILSATGARAPIIDDHFFARLAANGTSRPPLCVDMGVPPDIDPAACAKAGARRIGMDDIVLEAECNREARVAQAADAREMVDAALPRFRERLTDRQYGSLFANLQAHYQETARLGAERLLKSLRHLDLEDRETINRWAAGQAKRFAHLPTVGVRNLLLNGPDGGLDAFLDGLDAKLVAKLRRNASAQTLDGTNDDPQA